MDKQVACIEDKKEDTTSDMLHDILPLAVAAMVITGLFKSLTRTRESSLWITSPSKKMTIKLPFYTALRVVRKKGWRLAEVEPIKHLSRWEHLKLVFQHKEAL